MTNLDKLKEIFPDDWDKFGYSPKWAEKEYNYDIKKVTIQDVYSHYFRNEEDMLKVIAPNYIWEKEYSFKKCNCKHHNDDIDYENEKDKLHGRGIFI